MKKLMLTAAALVAGVALAESGITSANIVGYTSTDYTTKKYVPFGCCFINTGSADATFKLSDIVLEGGNASVDMIQVLEPTCAAVSAMYRYVSAEQAVAWGDASFQGWYDEGLMTRKDDVEFPLGTGFLASFGSKTVTPRYAGQVIDGSYLFDCVGSKYVMFANPIPREITLGDIVLQGGNASVDMIQVLEDTKAGVTSMYRYVSEEQAVAWGDASYKGWYDEGLSIRKDDVKVAVGEAFLASFGSKNVKVVFPSAY